MTEKEFIFILDDLKLICKSIKIIRDENNPENRKYACGLTEDLVNRLYRDIQLIAGFNTIKKLENL